MEAGHHPQSMTVDIVEEDQDDIETETPVQRQDPSGELVQHDIVVRLQPGVRDNITAEEGETDITIVVAAEMVQETDSPVAVKEVIEEETGIEMTEMSDLMLGVEVLKLQHQEIHQEATQEHSY